MRTRPLSGWEWIGSVLSVIWERIGIVLSVIWLLVNVFVWYRYHLEYSDEWFYFAVDFWVISTISAWVIVGVLLEVWRWIRRSFEVK